MPRSKKLLFVDAHIWLDFYRATSDVGLGLLEYVEVISDSVIVTYQLESEVMRDRQSAIIAGMQGLTTQAQVAPPAILSDAQSTRALARNHRDAEKRVQALKLRLKRVLADPSKYDVIYQACQRIFHRDDPLVLTSDNPLRSRIRSRALRRLVHGCPPRGRSSSSISDGFNWEWMIECARRAHADLVVVSRNSDFGASFDGEAYANDRLRQEFSERVGGKCKLLLCTLLSGGLNHFGMTVSPVEEAAEVEFLRGIGDTLGGDGVRLEICRGPAKGVIGRFQRKLASGRVLLLVEMLGCPATIEVDEADVTSVD